MDDHTQNSHSVKSVPASGFNAADFDVLDNVCFVNLVLPINGNAAYAVLSLDTIWIERTMMVPASVYMQHLCEAGIYEPIGNPVDATFIAGAAYPGGGHSTDPHAVFLSHIPDYAPIAVGRA